MASNLININGEYVKFYITTNSQLPQLLKNSGAAVIYHKDNTTYAYNYITNTYTYSYDPINFIYVGGEMIASGYGFHNYSDVTAATYIVNNYDSDLANVNTRIDDNTNYITTTKEEIYNEPFIRFGNNLATPNKNTGEIAYVLGQHGERININQLIYNAPAKYEDLEIKSVNNYISYTTLNGIEHNKIKCGKTIDIPLGAYITANNVLIEVDNHDTNGITSVSVQSDIYNNFNYKLSNRNIENAVGTIEFATVSNTASTSVLTSFNGKTLLGDIIYNYTGTTTYKYYPYLKDLYGTSILSYEYIIPDRKNLVLYNNVKLNIINTLYSTKYINKNSATINNIIYNSTNSYYYFGNSNEEIVKVEISNSAQLFAIPNNYELHEVYQFADENTPEKTLAANYNSGIGDFNDYINIVPTYTTTGSSKVTLGTKINVTGNFYNLNINGWDTPIIYKAHNLDDTYLKFNIYYLSKNNLEINDKNKYVYFKLVKTNSDSIYTNLSNPVLNKNFNSELLNDSIPVQNLEWNSLYWSTLAELDYKI